MDPAIQGSTGGVRRPTSMQVVVALEVGRWLADCNNRTLMMALDSNFRRHKVDQSDKTLQDEILDVINAQESDTPDDGWLSTNESVETVSDFEMLAEQLNQVTEDRHRWKWAIIALHSGLQGLMVLALKGSNGLNVLRARDKKRWLVLSCIS